MPGLCIRDTLLCEINKVFTISPLTLCYMLPVLCGILWVISCHLFLYKRNMYHNLYLWHISISYFMLMAAIFFFIIILPALEKKSIYILLKTIYKRLLLSLFISPCLFDFFFPLCNLTNIVFLSSIAFYSLIFCFLSFNVLH